MNVSAAPTGALERELGWASMVVNEQISLICLDETDATRVPAQAARDRFEAFAHPAAIFGVRGLLLANDAWRGVLPEELPAWATSSAELVRRTRIAIHLPEATNDRGTFLAATLTPAHAAEEGAILIVCMRMTDAAIARELTITSDALVWSGSVRSPAIADHYNERMRGCLGNSPPREWQSFVNPEDVAKWRAAFAGVLHQGTPTELEMRLHIDGQDRPCVTRIVFTNNQRWFSVASEIPRSSDSERAALLERLRAARQDALHANRIKDQVLAAVSHELRAPVTTIMLWERVLRDPMADSVARLQALDAIHQSAVAQSRTVGDLLDMSRAISGKLHVDFRNVEIGKLVGSAVEGNLPQALAKRITLLHEGSNEPGEILADATRLRQVIDNLLSNAIKFTEPGGRVIVRVQRKRPVLTIEVEDDGCGIAAEAIEQIFEPFRQGEDALARRQGGLGLGLAIARQIAELHNGTLTAFSAGPGKGARMTLTLPTAGHRRAPSPPAGVVAPRALATVRVLVVDDDERVRNALALLLDRAGAVVERAESALVARDRILARAPQIILCDIAMPDENGYEFMRSLRAAGSNIPAIALTAYASRADAEQALSSGFDMHVPKPVDFERLVSSVAQLIQTRREKRT